MDAILAKQRERVIEPIFRCQRLQRSAGVMISRTGLSAQNACGTFLTSVIESIPSIRVRPR